MDDALRVRRIEGLGDLASDQQRVSHSQRPALEAIGEGWAFDELEDERRLAVNLLEAVDGADMRVIESREQTCLARESRAPFRIPREVGRQYLDSDVPTQPGVASTIHFAHAAGTQSRDHRIRAEGAPAEATLLGRAGIGDAGRRRFEEPRRCGLVAQQRFEFLAQRRVVTARLAHERSTILRLAVEGSVVELGQTVT